MEYLRYQSPDPSGNDADSAFSAVISKSKMNEILPNGFEYSIIYERVMALK
jgi:hypothetical protein